jgi:hypothetical protein
MSDRGFMATFRLELNRLGLRLEDSPSGGLVTSSDEAAAQFLAHLRTLPVGSTWRDIFPDLPMHWDLTDPETWTWPYRPTAEYDYPALPTGPIVMIAWPTDPGPEALPALVAAARAVGLHVYGAGWVPISNPAITERPARVVLDHTTTEAELHAFTAWIDAHPVVQFNGISRYGDERYAPD